jgi:two-component system KDP operon response regulator KdpE
MNTGRIVVASSRADKRSELRTALGIEGHRVAETASLEETTRRISSGSYDLLIADSRMDGVTLCRAIRPKSDLGIIVLAGEDTGQGRIDALNAGADDYIPVPFAWAEFLARVRAILRRVSPRGECRRIVLQDREVDLRSYEVKGPGSRIMHLTPREFHVLQYLIAHVNKPRTAQTLAQSIWRRDGEGDLEYVRVVIRQLRHKLEPNPGKPRYILTERSAGYRFQNDSQAKAQ